MRLRSAQGVRSVRVMETTAAGPDRRTREHSNLTASQRTQRARLAARARWAKDDGSKGTQAARDTFLARFDDEVDPHRELAPDERAKRAESARRAYFQRLAFNRHPK